jgi:hypothetical protein
MKPNLRSLLCGAAVAAFVIAPTVSGYSQTSAPPPPRHGSSSWAVAPVRTFSTTSLKAEDIVGTLTVAVRDGGPMTVEISGNPSRVGRVRVSQDGALLTVEG